MVFPFESLVDFSVVLTQEHELFRRAVREFVEREIAPRALEIDERDEAPLDLLRKMGEQGFFGLEIPEQYGGQGGDYRMAAILSEEVSRASPGLSVYFNSARLFSVPILLYGTEEQRRRYLPQIARGEKLAAFASTEPCCGSDVAGVRTRARRVGDRWVINGRKAFISSSDVAHYILVLARTSDPPDAGRRHVGLSMFVVERDAPGVKVEQCYSKLGLRGNHACEISLTDVEVPEESLVGREGMGFYYAMEAFNRSRIGIAAQAVGMAQAAFEKAFDYAHRREAFGVKIASFQAVQFSLVEMLAKIMTARLLTYMAAKLADEGRREFVFVASLAKYYATEVAEEVISDAVDVFGGAGVVRETGLERLYRDVKITQIYEGANNVQKLVAYRQLVRLLQERGTPPGGA